MALSHLKLLGAAAAMVMVLPWQSAHAELQVSLQITGSMDEIRAVLDTLQQSGVGAAAEDGQGLKLEVHSTATGAENAAPADAPAATPASPEAPGATPAPEPPLAIGEVKVEPPSVLAGAVLRVSAKVTDKEARVDTIGANLHSADKEFTFDLFDNGSHGDDASGDGVWTVNVAVPGAATPGDYTLTLYAYDATGARISLPDGAGGEGPVSASATLVVTP